MNYHNHKQHDPGSIEYRSDVDGLRAIAVLFVIAFHAFPNSIPGGFIGVDIFFVISGFLISSIIYSRIDNNSFSYTEFYFRRIKRIFPALIFVLITSLLFGWYVLFADEYKQLGKHVFAGAGFVSNLALWGEAGYFDNASETKPLLHLWSLGIEEQFYIIWPLLLGVAWKWKHNFLYITLFVAISSFAANIFISDTNQVFAFYFPFTRFWELMIGGILAYITLYKPHYLAKNTNWQSIVGLLFIALGVLLTREKSFPGWWPLLPTIGSFLVIFSDQKSWLNNNLLSSRILVSIGLISYPLYLWHWLLLSFARIIDGRNPSNEIIMVAIILSFILAWLTYKVIERPIRYSKHQKSSVAFLCILMILVGCTGYIIYQYDGLKFRSLVTDYGNIADDLVYRKHWSGWNLCANEGNSEGCRILDPSSEPSIAVIGDSHAGHLASGLADVFRYRNENVIIRLGPGCMPFYSIKIDNKEFFSCIDDHINQALDLAINSTSIKTIILSGYGNLALHGREGFSVNTQSYLEGYSSNYSEQQVDTNIIAFKNAMHTTLEKLTNSGKKIIFIVDVPELYFNPRECVSLRSVKLTSRKLRLPCTLDRKLFEKRTENYHQLVADAEKSFPKVKFIHTYKYLCNDKNCDILVNGNLLYSSRDHLTTYGSRYLLNRINNELN